MRHEKTETYKVDEGHMYTNTYAYKADIIHMRHIVPLNRHTHTCP